MIKNVNEDDVLINGLQDIFSKQASSPTRPLTLLSFSKSIHLSYYLTPFQLCTTSAKKTKAGFFNKPYNRRVQKIKTLSHERPKKPAPAIMCTVKRCPCSSSKRLTGQPKWRQIHTVFESFQSSQDSDPKSNLRYYPKIHYFAKTAPKQKDRFRLIPNNGF